MSDGQLGELIQRAAAGDQEAARLLVARYENAIQASIRAGLGNDLKARVSASDVFQSTMISALADLQKLEFHGEAAFVGWLKTIAERQLLMAARFHSARKRDIAKEKFLGTSPAHAAEQLSPSQGAVAGEMTELIRDAVHKLPSLERRVVELHSFEGHSFAKVSDELSLSGAARARYIFQRALKSLGRMLDDVG